MRESNLVSVEDLRDATVADAQLPRDDARPDAGGRHLDDLQPDVVGQRPAVDEDAAQLVDAALTFETSKSQGREKIEVDHRSLIPGTFCHLNWDRTLDLGQDSAFLTARPPLWPKT